jgi:hypothetical protein
MEGAQLVRLFIWTYKIERRVRPALQVIAGGSLETVGDVRINVEPLYRKKPHHSLEFQ